MYIHIITAMQLNEPAMVLPSFGASKKGAGVTLRPSVTSSVLLFGGESVGSIC